MVATSKLGSLSSIGVIFACVVFRKATRCINSYPQSTRKPGYISSSSSSNYGPSSSFHKHKMENKINEWEGGTYLLVWSCFFCCSLKSSDSFYYFFFCKLGKKKFMLILLLQTKKNQEERIKGKKTRNKKIVFFF